MRFVLTLFFLPLAAFGKTFSSGPKRVALIELFSSEGCSSCPPADAWMRDRQKDPGLWKSFVPVAFQVDYWDKLGWKDALASPQYSLREVAYTDVWKAENVYTPCFVLNGREWTKWEKAKSISLTEELAEPLVLETLPGEKYRVTYTRAGEAHLALEAVETDSQVKAGENNGRNLVHAFVTLQLQTAKLKTEKGKFVAEFKGEWPKLTPAPKRSVAAWVTTDKTMEPRQAVGGFLD